jgi:methionine-rich copper-binding protein CopC
MILQGSLGLFNAAARFGAGARRRGVVAGLAFSAVFAFLLFMPLAPATAHDAIESTEPAEGAVVAEVPAEVKLTVNNVPIALGAAVQIKDESGTDQSGGKLVIRDNVVSQTVRAGAPAGLYTVTWRVVSSDSHPIEGRFTFTAGDTSGSPPSAAEPASPFTATGETAPSAVTPWALLAGGASAIAALLVMARFVRRRLPKESGRPS